MSIDHYQLPAVTIPQGEALRIYTADQTLTGEDLLGTIAYLISTFRSGATSNKGALEAVLAAFTLAIPELVNSLAAMRSFVVEIVNVGSVDVERIATNYQALGGPFANFPWISPPSTAAIEVTSVEGVYAGLASLLIAMGKQGGIGPEAAAVKARPAALVSRFGIPVNQQLILPGQLHGPTIEALDRIFTAFSTYTEPRACIIKYFLAVSIQQGHLPLQLEILMTNFRMMKGSGMTHVDAITKLMNMHPWTVRVPELRPYYERFSNELAEFSKVPLSVRKYHRLLVPQSEFLFLTPEYRPLIAVAGSFVEQVEKTFSGYVYGKDEFSLLISKVQAYQPGTATYIGTGTLAAKLGIQDMTLPSTSARSIIPVAQMV